MRFGKILKFIVAVIICELAGVVGSLFTASAVRSGWYEGLVKPALNPPGWIFGPMWVTLYFLMGISLWLVWVNNSSEKKKAVLMFAIQLALNAVWSPIFFGTKSLGNALAIIVLLWAAIVLTIFIFRKVSRPAAWLLAPYILWVSFAGYLNYSIWNLNHDAPTLVPVACTMEAKLCPDGSYVGRTGPKCEFALCPKEDLIQVESPRAGEIISSPLAIKGKARGNWFFEASFPVVLVDWDGKIIAQTIATAKGDPADSEASWMTTEFVPFEAELKFEKPEFIGDFSRRGALIFKKDNPSGLPEHDDALEMPILFSQ
jgi:tryptophan-rich sensory protein